MIIREAKISDCDEIWDLCKLHKELFDSDGKPPKKWWVEGFVKENQISLVAEDESQVIGFALGERTVGDIALFHMLAVKEEFQDKGIGKKLIERFEEECKKRRLGVIMAYGYAKGDKINHILEKRDYEKGNKYFEYHKWLDKNL